MPIQTFAKIEVTATILTIEEGGERSVKKVTLSARYRDLSPSFREKMLELALPEIDVEEHVDGHK